MAGRDRDEKQEQRECERELSKHHVSVGLHLRVCAIIIPPLQILLDKSSRDGIFFLSSMLYLLLDVLFLYVPLVNEGTKCLTLDKRMKIAALVFRSVGDSRYLIRIYVRIKDGWGKSPALGKLLGLAVCVLPVPQVAILLVLPNTRGSNSLKTLTVLNCLVASQYFPRAYPLYEMYKAINFVNVGDMRSRKRNLLSFVHIHAKWMLNIFGYLVASHIFGAFWYYFSIQQEIVCWVYACKSENGCEFSTSCVQSTHRSIRLLRNLCPTNPPDKHVFDFGIFHDALESGMQRSTNFSHKYLQCLSWAIRNLRFARTYYTLGTLGSFGSNLNTSASGSENLLVVVFSICGLVLFMYLLGHMQTFMQKVGKDDIIRERMKMINFRLILDEYRLIDENHEMERKIKLAVKDKLEDDQNYIVEPNMFSILSLEEARSFVHEIKCALFFDKLKKVDGLQHKDDLVLKKICKHLKPVLYNESSYMIREGEPLDRMFFLTQGIVLIYDSSGFSRTVEVKEKSGLYGEELINWVETASTQESNLPFSTRTIKSHSLVEIFAIKVTDLQREVPLDRHNVNNILSDIESS